jgi:hypothetical protein
MTNHPLRKTPLPIPTLKILRPHRLRVVVVGTTTTDMIMTTAVEHKLLTVMKARESTS